MTQLSEWYPPFYLRVENFFNLLVRDSIRALMMAKLLLDVSNELLFGLLLDTLIPN